MTSKKRRQRGSRTHGGGTHKNRRGAGNRGGRGNAGRNKHQFHNHGPLGKHGFTRPSKVQDEVKTIAIQRLDEDVTLFVAEELAVEVDDGYRIDVRDIVHDGHAVDTVKVLGGGQVRHRLEVVADAFSDGAREGIEAAGGEALLSDRARQAAEAKTSVESDDDDHIDTAIEGETNGD